ncbi:MAG: antitoxin VapB family protein [Candidatus Methylomirabilales bacterium]
MGFKTISLRDEVYRRLRAEKRSGESLSDVILRLLEGEQPSLGKYAGAWRRLKPEELRAIRERIERLRHGSPAR